MSDSTSEQDPATTPELGKATSETGDKLGKDVFIALAAVGWADGDLASDEADAIVRCALEEGLELEEIEAIETATKTSIELGAIDIKNMTKADRLFVYAVASWIVNIDGKVAESEKDVLARLGAVLKVPEAPRQHAEDIAKKVGESSESDKPAFFNLPKLRRTLKVRLEEARQQRAEAAAQSK